MLVLSNILLAFGYFVLAKLCQSFAIEPGNVTPIWLASGLCFVVVYIKGYRLLPGVFLGAFIGNVSAYLFPIDNDLILNSIIAGIFNGIGDTLCTFVGVYALRQSIMEDLVLGNLRSASVFVFISVFFSSLISALFGVTGLTVSGIIPTTAYTNTLITWLVGDAMGILIVVPLVMNVIVGEFRLFFESKFHFLEALIGLSISIFLLHFSFSTYDRHFFDIPILLIVPLLGVFAFRHSESVMNIIINIISIVAMYFAINYSNPAVSLNDKLLYTQLFIFSVASTLYFIISSINWNQRLSLEMTRRDRLATLGEFVAGIAHEINNPLAIISNSVEIIGEDPKDSEVISIVNNKAKDSVARITRIIDSLRRFVYQGVQLNFDWHSTKQIVENALVFVDHKMLRHNVPISINDLNDIQLYCDDVQVQQILINLINNAIDAVKDQEQAWVKISCITKKDHYLFQVLDSGQGIDEIKAHKMFNPFYTTKVVGEGSGLGLSISSGIAKEHGGDLIYKKLNGNTSFILSLPIKDKS